MWSRRKIALGIFLSTLAATVLFGCRAFEPEAVIVNNPPETYIIGAPAETTGGYYHFHVYWYGTDSDGEVEKFVWALTDTSLQDRETDDDEEDRNFDPADNISTLEIGHYTTRTDSVFDFTIDQGPSLAYGMTLHMVAIDDRGDFDRSPARLEFISNALGNPQVTYEREMPDGSGTWVPFANLDTIGYRQSFTLRWGGSTPNTRAYPESLLARNDTMGAKDGLQGFKYRLPEEACDEAVEDCWHPRRYDDASGDSVSYFGDVLQYHFANQNPSSIDMREKELAAGIHELLINTIDVAGVDVPGPKQRLQIEVNYDPDSYLLKDQTDPFFPSDQKVYPYYRVFYPARFGARVEEHTFAELDTLPDRSYAVFKAVGRDDSRDEKLDPSLTVGFQGAFTAVGLWDGLQEWSFQSGYGALHRTEAWAGANADSWSSDTLGFFVGPFRYDFSMRAVDEHGTRDGTADRFSFYANHAPCVQCVEVLGWDGFGYEQAATTYDDPCYEQACAAEVDTLYATLTAVPGLRRMNQLGVATIWYNTVTRQIFYEFPQSAGVHSELVYVYAYKLALSGKDHAEEPFTAPERRIMSWRYQITSERDPLNTIADGEGRDNLNQVTRNFSLSDTAGVYVDEDGTWLLRVKIRVPVALLAQGPAAYREQLYQTLGPESGQIAFELLTQQLGLTTAEVVARDVSDCDWQPDASAYIYFEGARYEETDFGMRGCGALDDRTVKAVPLTAFPFESERPLRTNASGNSYRGGYTKHYVLRIRASTGEVFP